MHASIYFHYETILKFPLKFCYVKLVSHWFSWFMTGVVGFGIFEQVFVGKFHKIDQCVCLFGSGGCV